MKTTISLMIVGILFSFKLSACECNVMSSMIALKQTQYERDLQRDLVQLSVRGLSSNLPTHVVRSQQPIIDEYCESSDAQMVPCLPDFSTKYAQLLRNLSLVRALLQTHGCTLRNFFCEY